jgi:hypothetical protein
MKHELSHFDLEAVCLEGRVINFLHTLGCRLRRSMNGFEIWGIEDDRMIIAFHDLESFAVVNGLRKARSETAA